jgi:hypothetical protein
MFFNVDADSGRLEINERFAPLATTFKERAAFTQRHLLAALPAGPFAHQYILFDMAAGGGRVLLGRPGADNPEAQALWDGLHQHYAGELHSAVVVTQDDWPRIAQEWQAFFRKLDTAEL